MLFLLGINYGGRQYAWTSAHVIAPMVVGVLCLIALGFYEVYADLPLPIMPPKIFRKWREVTMIYVICFVGGMLYCMFYLPLHLLLLHETNQSPSPKTPST